MKRAGVGFIIRGAKRGKKAFRRLALPERGEAPCVHVMGLLEPKMEQIDAQIRHLQELRCDLRQLLAEGEQLPLDDVQMEGCVCGLIRGR